MNKTIMGTTLENITYHLSETNPFKVKIGATLWLN